MYQHLRLKDLQQQIFNSGNSSTTLRTQKILHNNSNSGISHTTPLTQWIPALHFELNFLYQQLRLKDLQQQTFNSENSSTTPRTQKFLHNNPNSGISHNTPLTQGIPALHIERNFLYQHLRLKDLSNKPLTHGIPVPNLELINFLHNNSNSGISHTTPLTQGIPALNFERSNFLYQHLRLKYLQQQTFNSGNSSTKPRTQKFLHNN